MKTVKQLKKEALKADFKFFKYQIKKSMSEGHTRLALSDRLQHVVEVYEDKLQGAGFTIVKNGGGTPYAITWGDDK